jgi:hypothetical protein
LTAAYLPSSRARPLLGDFLLPSSASTSFPFRRRLYPTWLVTCHAKCTSVLAFRRKESFAYCSAHWG